MAVRIKFDNTHNVIPPTFVLATRGGHKLGPIPAVNVSVSDSFNSHFELEFRVNKYDNGVAYPLWDKLTDFKLAWCREWDVWFEMYVTVQDDNDTVKNVSCVSVGEAELSQINLYGIEINTETDIAHDDYVATVLYNAEKPEGSLLHRIMEKAPHYSIKHVDASIAKIQRTFTFDGTSLYDAFQAISEELDCIFVIDSGSADDGSISRSISVYDLESYCLACGTRDNFSGNCPECGSDNVLHGYGEDTCIFISTENLADNITLKTDTDSVKNCFRLEAGDDLMTATVRSCNPNGSQYIWYVSDDVKKDMSDELVAKLAEYDRTYNYYQNEYVLEIPNEIRVLYDALIEKYRTYKSELKKLPESVVGYPQVMNVYYDTIDMYMFLHDSLMPSSELQRTTAALQAARLGSNTLSPVAVQDITKCSSSSASSAVLAVAKTIVDPRYQVKLKNGVLDGTVWVGNFTVTNYSDETDTAESVLAQVTITDDYETYVKQKVNKALKNAANDDITDIASPFKLPLSQFKEELKKYCLTSLQTFGDACQTCLDILIEQGVADRETWANKNPDLYTTLYLPYYDKLLALQDEIKLRESEIQVVIGAYNADGDLTTNGIQPVIEAERTRIQNALNFEGVLGTDLWLEFVAYRREDSYSNSNYISDGLDNGELFSRALEFIETAKKEIYKSATQQHSLSASLKNLLVMKEFAPIVDKFSVGNWIRVKVDDAVFRLRLINYSIDFEDLDNISIEFSDVKKYVDGVTDSESIISQAASMASTYDTVTRQASQGKKSSQQLDDWVTKGLALTKMKIVDNADNQNITWDSHGLLCREYLPTTDAYSDKQLKIINRGLYLTDDNWRTSKAGIGDFTYYNPETRKFEEAYGVIADTLIGNLILSEKVGVYNTNNSIVMGENGLTITTDATQAGANMMAMTVQRKTLDGSGNEVITPVMYLDGDGNLVLTGTIRIQSSVAGDINSIGDLCDINRFTEKITQIVTEQSEPIYSSIEEKYKSIIDETTAQLESYKADIGQYMQFNDDGLTLGAITSDFKTVIDNRGLYFKQGDTTVAYINNNQLYIPNAVIQQTLVLGKFFFNPRADGGVSLTWQGG